MGMRVTGEHMKEQHKKALVDQSKSHWIHCCGWHRFNGIIFRHISPVMSAIIHRVHTLTPGCYWKYPDSKSIFVKALKLCALVRISAMRLHSIQFSITSSDSICDSKKGQVFAPDRPRLLRFWTNLNKWEVIRTLPSCVMTKVNSSNIANIMLHCRNFMISFCRKICRKSKWSEDINGPKIVLIGCHQESENRRWAILEYECTNTK